MTTSDLTQKFARNPDSLTSLELTSLITAAPSPKTADKAAFGNPQRAKDIEAQAREILRSRARGESTVATSDRPTPPADAVFW